jgi:hypothetical protein
MLTHRETLGDQSGQRSSKAEIEQTKVTNQQPTQVKQTEALNP